MKNTHVVIGKTAKVLRKMIALQDWIDAAGWDVPREAIERVADFDLEEAFRDLLELDDTIYNTWQRAMSLGAADLHIAKHHVQIRDGRKILLVITEKAPK